MRTLLDRLQNFLHHQSRSVPRGIKKCDRTSRGRSQHRPLSLETMEGRLMLSLTPQLVLDINTKTLPSSPSGLVAIGSTAYFTADDGINGRELWKTSGTAAGTALV